MRSLRSPVGAHVGVAGGLMRALTRARDVEAEAIQIFAGNPRGWRNPVADPAGDATFAAEAASAGLPVYVHAPYLINFGSPNPQTLEKSTTALRFNLERAKRIGAGGVVLHAGSALIGGDWDTAMAQLREVLLPLLDDVLGTVSDAGPSSVSVPLLIEPTAGGGGALAHDLTSLSDYLDFLGRDERIGVCLDTCHLFAAGHDLSSVEGMRTVLDEAKAVAGAPGIRLIHVNDSRDPLGSKRDRHAAIGSGEIGLAAFTSLFDSSFADVPLIVETADADHAADIAALKKLRDG